MTSLAALRLTSCDGAGAAAGILGVGCCAVVDCWWWFWSGLSRVQFKLERGFPAMSVRPRSNFVRCLCSQH